MPCDRGQDIGLVFWGCEGTGALVAEDGCLPGEEAVGVYFRASFESVGTIRARSIEPGSASEGET